VRSTTTYRKKKNKADGNQQINQYKIIKTLGKGSYATVKLVQDATTDEYFAMKAMNKKDLTKQKIGKSSNAYMYVKEELKVLQKLEHPNIIYLHEIIDDPSKDYLYLIT